MTRVVKVAVLAAFCAVLAACGGSSPEGQWSLDKEKTKNSVQTAIKKQMEEREGPGMEEEMMTGMLDAMMEAMNITMDVRADNTFTASVPMGPSLTGTWTRDGDKVTFKPSQEGEEAMVATLNGDELVLSPPDDELPDARLYLKRNK